MELHQKAQQFGEAVAAHIKKIHEEGPGYRRELPDDRRWDPVAGQWLVYGLERYIGFANGVTLESVVERTWRNGGDVATAAAQEYLRWFPAKGETA